MTGEMDALARRAVACKGWRWMEGMRAKSPNGMMSCRVSFYDLNRQPHMLPDFTDPATLGCLLALVREVWGDLQAFCATEADTAHIVWWVVRYGNASAMAGGQSEAEALVSALEAAP